MTARERAHREAVRADIETIAERLQDVLGQRMTAFAVGLRDPRAIGRYAKSLQTPTPATEQRLRNVFEITRVLLYKETPSTARAWMLGSHPLLEDRAPIELLHEDDHPPVERTAANDSRAGYLTVVNAAEEFVTSAA